MKSVYKILDEIRDHFRGNEITNEVSFGDFTHLDTAKTTIFPLVHMDIIDVVAAPRVLRFRLLVIAMGIVDQDYAEEPIDEFFGGSNLHDVYNEQLYVLTNFVESLRRGDLYSEKVRIVGEPSFEPFENRFDNMLAGWGGEVTIELPNLVSVC
jgi:hypothetical protein